MSGLSESTVRMWSPPTSRRKFRTKHQAAIAWAKDLIRARACGCDPDYRSDGPGPFTCPWHERLFTVPAFACSQCGAPDEPPGGPCGNCERGRFTVPTTIPGNARYMKLRNRLARWLRWASEAAPTRAA